MLYPVQLWRVVWAGWARFRLWTEPEPGHELKSAIFRFHLPRFPGLLWRNPVAHAIASTDTTAIDAIHSAVHTAWQQHVHDVFAVLWKWRHDVEDDRLRWQPTAARAYLRVALRTTLLSLGRRLQPLDALHDPRRSLLRSMADAFGEPELACPAPAVPVCLLTRLLVFDGGSRGNPGPGGAGAVIVEVDMDAIHPRVVWSACMAYGQSTMTNNRAEYLGALAGLREADRRGWTVDVIGDSALIIRQLAHFLTPKHSLLRPSTVRPAASPTGSELRRGTIIGAITTGWPISRRTRPWTSG